MAFDFSSDFREQLKGYLFCVCSPIGKSLFKWKFLEFDTNSQVWFDPGKVLLGVSLEAVQM